MHTAVFDIGGVLRKVRLPGSNETYFAAMRDLYRTLREDPEWRVVVVTRKPADVSDDMVLDELKALKLERPAELVVLHGGTKLAAYERLAPSVVFDDEPECITHALHVGAAGCLVR